MLCGQHLTRSYFFLLFPLAFLLICNSYIFARWGLVKTKHPSSPRGLLYLPGYKQSLSYVSHGLQGWCKMHTEIPGSVIPAFCIYYSRDKHGIGK